MIQVYTGNGKGKTTAAIGLALRVLGAEGRVYMAQFIKDHDTAEAAPLRRAGAVVEQYGRGLILGRAVGAADREAVARGVEAVREQLTPGRNDLVIMDEANVALSLDLMSTRTLTDIMQLVAEQSDAPELVITGRGAEESVLARADLVTEMREIKHYFNRGLDARLGIEY